MCLITARDKGRQHDHCNGKWGPRNNWVPAAPGRMALDGKFSHSQTLMGRNRFSSLGVFNLLYIFTYSASQVALVVKNSPANAGASGSIPGSGRSPGGGHSNPLQYSCLGNLMDRGAWQATVHDVTKGQTRLKQLSTHPYAVK